MEHDKIEEGFEIKHDTAIISSTDSESVAYAKLHNGHFVKVDTGGIVFNPPKRYVFNPDARVKDFDKLVLFLLENMRIYDDAKGFDKVSYMFKEADGK